MVNIGVIAEYNPFHNGHKYLIDKAKSITKSDNAVVVCSGNYVQRGEPAIFDKYTRAKQAIRAGVDAIFELPVYYATASAETFARASVKFFIDLGCIDYICFGCETDNIAILPQIAKILHNEPEEYKQMLAEQLKEGLSFPKARSIALEKYCKEYSSISDAEISLTLKSSNNILAIEYLKALLHFNSNIKPVAIKRIGEAYTSASLDSDFVSATAIRKAVFEGKNISYFVPQSSLPILNEAKPLCMKDFELILGEKLSNINQKQWFEVPGDLAKRINNNSQSYTDLEHLLNALYTKNYTNTSIARSLIKTMLEIDNIQVDKFIEDGYHYNARLLGLNRDSTIMGIINDNSSIPIISRYSQYYRDASGVEKQALNLNLQADNLYRLVYMTKYKEIIPNEFEQHMIT